MHLVLMNFPMIVSTVLQFLLLVVSGPVACQLSARQRWTSSNTLQSNQKSSFVTSENPRGRVLSVHVFRTEGRIQVPRCERPRRVGQA
jgi:hypothetical protein